MGPLLKRKEYMMKFLALSVLLGLLMLTGGLFPKRALAQDYTTTLANCTTSMNRSTGQVNVTCTPVYSSPFATSFPDYIPPLSCEPASQWRLSGAFPAAKAGSTVVTAVQGYGGVSCHDSVSLHVYEVNPDNSMTTLCWKNNPTEIAFGYVPYVECPFVAPSIGVHHLVMSTNRGPYVKWDLTVDP
jgi:hypothetical protein